MLSLTKKADYALIALAHLGRNWTDHHGPTSARQIADDYALPSALLMNILKDLAAAGIVTSTRGARGGYALARQPTDICLLDIFVALEGPIHLVQCCSEAREGDPTPCSHHGRCPIEQPMRTLDDRLRNFFQTVTLDELMTENASRNQQTPLRSNGITTSNDPDTRQKP